MPRWYFQQYAFCAALALPHAAEVERDTGGAVMNGIIAALLLTLLLSIALRKAIQ
jgi:hypothetical protein